MRNAAFVMFSCSETESNKKKKKNDAGSAFREEEEKKPIIISNKQLPSFRPHGFGYKAVMPCVLVAALPVATLVVMVVVVHPTIFKYERLRKYCV